MEGKCPYCGSETLLEPCMECGDPYCEECLFPPERGGGRAVCPNCDGRAGPEAPGPALECPVCGDTVAEDGLREHLVLHDPNARGMDWEDVRNAFRPRAGGGDWP
jgi:hypothetical protein